MNQVISWALICLLIVCQILAFIIFMSGLWPMKISLTGYGNLSDLPPEPFIDESTNTYERLSTRELYQPAIKNLVIMVIDALRYDFVVDHNFPYLGELLKKGNAIKFHAKAHPPTVTLPKIKTITSGSLPSYTDVIFNFNAQNFLDDNLIHQAHHHKMRIIFFGDDTWIRLFPHHFDRFDGTTSFFVQDFTEVDDNVTRHLDRELKNVNWNILILHYLGLDHIGHIHGPKSSLVNPKLQEMDGIIKKITHSLQIIDQNRSLPSLFVICGDHGMSNYGSHGGSSDSETSIPLIFISSKKLVMKPVESKTVAQSALAPTLSILLGLPIPINNIGIVLTPLLSMLNPREQLYGLYVNAHQIMKLINVSQTGYIKDYFNELYKHAVNMHVQILSSNKLNDESVHGVCQMYIDALDEMSHTLMSSAVNQDIYLMIVAVILLWEVLLFLLGKASFEHYSQEHFIPHLPIKCSLVGFLVSLIHWNICIDLQIKSSICSTEFTSVVLSIFIIAVISWLTVNINPVFIFRWKNSDPSLKLIISVWMLHAMSLFATSFIEEEHQTWYFLSTSFHLVLAVFALYANHINEKTSETIQGVGGVFNDEFTTIRQLESLNQTVNCNGVKKLQFRFPAVITFTCLGLIRIFRSWNQTGDKWAHLDDIKYWLYLDDNSHYLNVSIGIGFCILYYLRSSKHSSAERFLLATLLLTIGIHHYGIKFFSKEIQNTIGLVAPRIIFLFVALIVLELMLVNMKLLKASCTRLIEHFISGWLLLSCLLVRPHNIFLLSMFVLHEHLISKLLTKSTVKEMTAIYYCLGMTSYFYMGNSNNLARIDVAAGFAGQSNYNLYLSGLLIWCHMYIGPMFWILSLLSRLLKTCTQNKYSIKECCCILMLARSLPSAIFIISVALQRSHLFVWSVFSPKLLFEGMHCVFIATVIVMIKINSTRTTRS